MVKYTEELVNLKKEIKREFRTSSFDTIYTSVIVLLASIIISMLISGSGGNLILIISGIAIALALVFQFMSLFYEPLKLLSIWFLLLIILFVVLVYSYILFPVSDSSWTGNLLTARNIISAIAFILLYFVVVIPFTKLFD